MSTGLLEQLDVYFDQVEGSQDPVTDGEVRTRLGSIPLVVSARPARRGVWVAVAAAVLVLLLIGVLPMLLTLNETGPIDQVTSVPSPVTTITPDTTISPATTVPSPNTTISRAAGSVTWTKHEGRVPPGDGYTYDETPVGLMATRTEDFQAPKVYMSSNGLEWTEILIPAAARVLTEYSHDFGLEPTATGIWLNGPEGGLWFTELDSWASGNPSWDEAVSEADLAALKRLAPPGTQRSPFISGKARIGNTSLIAIEWDLTIDIETILDLPSGYTDVRTDDLDSCYPGGEPGQAAVQGLDSSGEAVCLTRVTLVNEGGGVTVLDESGSQVAHIENTLADFDFGDGGPRIRLREASLDLYASIDGQLELIRSNETMERCEHGLVQHEDSVVHIIDCDGAAQNKAWSTNDGVTWEQVPIPEHEAALFGRHPAGFHWQSTWPWGLDDDIDGPPAILVSQDGVSWTDLVVGHGPVVEASGGIVITQSEQEGGLADEIVLYDGESATAVQVDWPTAEWPEFLGAIGNSLILVYHADVWIAEVFEN